MSKTLADLPQGRIFYCVTCDCFIEEVAATSGIKRYWEGGRNHTQQNPGHEVHDVFVDKKWHERATAKEPTTWLLAGAYEWKKALEGAYDQNLPKDSSSK
jgi:hypothetical protein